MSLSNNPTIFSIQEDDHQKNSGKQPSTPTTIFEFKSKRNSMARIPVFVDEPKIRKHTKSNSIHLEPEIQSPPLLALSRTQRILYTPPSLSPHLSPNPSPKASPRGGSPGGRLTPTSFEFDAELNNESHLQQGFTRLSVERKSSDHLVQFARVLSKMQLNIGQSIAELSLTHRIVIFTIKYTGDPLSQALIDKVGTMLLSMLHLNTIPIIGHQEDDNRVEQFLRTCKNHATRNLLFVKVDKECRKEFGLKNASLLSHLKSLGQNLSTIINDRRTFGLPSDVIAPFTEFGVFVIENSCIKKKIIYEDLQKVINFGAFLQDLQFYTNINTQRDSNLFEDLVKMFPKLHIDDIRSVSRNISIKLSEKGNKNMDTLASELFQVLKNDTERYCLKAFAINEVAPEGINFYEDVTHYQKITDQKEKIRKINVILFLYLQKDSISKVNTSSELIDAVFERIARHKDDGNYPSDLFDIVLNDVVNNTILDTFFRFKLDPSYENMKTDKGNVINFLV